MLLPASVPRKLRVGLREVAMDRNRILLIGSAIVLILLIASMLVGPGVQAKSTTAGREADIEELEELLPLYIEYHRAAKWLPDPHRADN
jgi:hypothetical protein